MGEYVTPAPNARVKKKLRLHFLLLMALSAGAAVSPANVAMAQSEMVEFNIPSLPLGEALRVYSNQSRVGVQRNSQAPLPGNAPAVVGRYSTGEALRQLLAGTGVQFRFLQPDAVMIDTAADRRSELTVPATPALADVRTNVRPLAMPGVTLPEEIVVTGTRIRGGAAGSETISFSRAQLEETGRATTIDVIRTLPQNSGVAADPSIRGSNSGGVIPNIGAGSAINLRGLGSDATLTLLNGRRMAPAGQGLFVDVSLIPLSALERVEVVLDGASAIYGSDAIGGVVNFILRRNYDGAESSARYDHIDGSRRVAASQTVGYSWDGGNIFASYEYFRQSRLDVGSRDYMTADLRRFGGTDLRSNFSNPGTISANGTTYAIPIGQNGRGLTAAQLVAGTQNLMEPRLGTDILPDQMRHNAVLTLNQDVGDRVHLFADILYSNRRSVLRDLAQTAVLSVPSTNPYFVSPTPGARTVTVFYSFYDDLGPQVYKSRSEDLNLSAGATYDIAGSWKATTYASFASNVVRGGIVNFANSLFYGSALASSNAAVALNPFGDGSFTPSTTLDSLQTLSVNTNQRYRTRTISADLGGDILSLPGGDVRIALGAEGRSERYENQVDNFTSTPQPIVAAYSTKARHVVAIYGELLVPIVGDQNSFAGVRKLDVSVAGRFERYSDFGSTANPKIGLRWLAASEVTLRGTWGKSFKAPFLQQTDESANTIGTFLLNDPTSPTGTTRTLAYSGNNAELQPEKATTWSAGFDLRPELIPGLSLGATYFDIHYINRILQLSAADSNAALGRPDIYGSLYTRNPSAATVLAAYADSHFAGTQFPASQIGAVLDRRLQNIGSVKQSGFDLSAAYRFETPVGSFDLSANATRVTKYRVKRTSIAPSVDQLNVIGKPIDLRFRTGVAWANGPYRASIFLNYIDDYTNTLVPTPVRISSWRTIDSQVAFDGGEATSWARGWSLAISVQNLLDVSPPAVANTTAMIGYDPEAANALGRVVSLKLSKRW